MNAARWLPWLGAPVLALALLARPLVARSETTNEAPDAAPAADATRKQPGAAEPATAAPEPAAHWNAHGQRARRGGLDDRVRLLAAELQLDTQQQLQVRSILEEQRAMTLKTWSDNSVPAAVRVKSTQAIGDQTADRIRAILNDKQREKYIKPLPPEARPAATSTNVERYIDATQRK